MALLCAAGCEQKPDAVYVTRGEVTARHGSLEDERIVIHHERIPVFIDRDGNKAPMASMRMAFGLAPKLRGVDAPVGSKVQVAFEVRWDTSPFLTIAQLERLDESTPLALSEEHAPAQ